MPEKMPLPEDLSSAMGRLKTRCLALACVQGAGFGVFAFLTVVTLTGWTDLLVALPAAYRFAILLASSLGAVAILAVVLARTLARTSPTHLASALDRAGETGGQICAGVELAGMTPNPDAPAVSADLVRRAIAASSRLAKKQDPAKAQPAAFAFKPIGASAALAAALCAAWFVWPDMIAVQAARMLDPRGQHFSAGPYMFDVKPSALNIVYGDPFEVVVTISGAKPHETFEWVATQLGKPENRYPLIGRGDGTLFGNLNSVVSDFEFYISGPRGRSSTFRIGVLNAPVVREVALRLVYPSYTGLPPFEGPLIQGGPSGVRGTIVTLFIAANKPLAGGKLEVHPDRDASGKPLLIQMKPPATAEAVAGRGANVVSGSFEIVDNLKFSAWVSAPDGLSAKEPVEGRCLMIEDQPPTVRIREPRVMSFATPDISLPVIIEAEDDFGIGEVKLYRSLNGSRQIATSLPLDKVNARQMQLETKLPLNEWSLEAGDVIELYATARDNDPGPPPMPNQKPQPAGKIAESPVHRITIISKEHYLEMLREQETIDDLQERYKPWLAKLAKLREKWQEASKNNDPKKMAEVKEALRESLDELKEQLKEPPVFASDFQFAKELRDLEESLKKTAQDLDEGKYDDVSRALGERDEKLKKNLELPLDLLTKYYHLMEDQALYTALTQAQQDIATRAKRFSEEKTGQDVRDLKAMFDEQHQVAMALQKLLQDIRDHAGKLPQEDKRFKKLIQSANEFCTKASDLKIDEALNQAEVSFFKRETKGSHEAAQNAADLMASLLKKGAKGFGEKAQDDLGEFDPSLGETADQLLNSQGLPGLGGKSKGGGRSMRGSGNAGVYGSKPQKRGGGAGGKEKRDGSGPMKSGQKLDDVGGFGMRDEFDDGSSGGVPLSAVPARYRGAVRDYNRRVADDLSKKE